MLEQILLSLKILWFFVFTAMLLCGMGYALIHVFHTGRKYLRTCAARRRQIGLITTFPPGMQIRSVPASSVFIGSRVSIGSNVEIKSGVTLWDGARVLADSVVTRNVPPGVTVAGSPAEEVAFIRASPAELIS